MVGVFVNGSIGAIGVVLIELMIDIGAFCIARKALKELLLYLIESLLVLPPGFLAIRINSSGAHIDSFLKNAIEIELIREFNIQIDPSFMVAFMDVPKTIHPHVEIIPRVPFTIRINDFTQLAIDEVPIRPLHFLRTN